MSASAGGGKPWAAASARSLARRLRRERQAERGWFRAAALSRCTKALRASLDVHWRLCDAVGCYLPTLGEEVATARLLGCDPALLAEADAALVEGNSARHAPPPGAARGLPKMPDGLVARALERLLEGAAPPLRCNAEPFVPASVRLASALLCELGVEQVACNPSVVPPVQGHSHVVVDVEPLRDAAGADDASVSEDSQLVVNLGRSAEDVVGPLVACSAKPLEEVREDPDVLSDGEPADDPGGGPHDSDCVALGSEGEPADERGGHGVEDGVALGHGCGDADGAVIPLVLLQFLVQQQDAGAVVHEGDLIVWQLEQIEDSIQSEAHLMKCETEVQEAIDKMIDQGLVSVMRPSLGQSRASRLLAASRPAVVRSWPSSGHVERKIGTNRNQRFWESSREK
ncbi:unnamed protein product [Prorocentrum cordatum]|uniref:Mcm6 C-terminal winged-helix domain-containing protein n=1 Tax=Prorocentrum cordatum TaxID=2364126 RepID=A0ABN9QN59_9DINO|nr:unnamed protein product [Polarella glacialis]